MQFSDYSGGGEMDERRCIQVLPNRGTENKGHHFVATTYLTTTNKTIENIGNFVA
jgi:hypothetical protein